MLSATPSRPRLAAISVLKGLTPLHWAARFGQEAVVRALLVDFEDDVNVPATDSLYTPLHYSAFWGDAQVVELLLASGANPNARTNVGSTPLHFAAAGGHGEAVAILLARGADAHAKSSDHRQTPADLAQQSGHPELVELLRRHEATVPRRGRPRRRAVGRRPTARIPRAGSAPRRA